MRHHIRKFKKHTVTFQYAFQGVGYTFRTQPNLRIHFFFALLAILLGVILKISLIEWVVIAFTIFWVIISEMINTSIESIVDLITKDYQVEAKVAKDVAAGMVLMGALGSIMVGLIIFGPKILALI